MSIAKPFVDVPKDHWAYQAVDELRLDGWVVGRSIKPSMYYPDSAITRAEIAVLVMRAKRGTSFFPPPATGLFPDVSKNYWGAKWIEQAYHDGLLGPSADGNYYPRNPATRADTAVLIWILNASKISDSSIGSD